jgi:hypothetical protein
MNMKKIGRKCLQYPDMQILQIICKIYTKSLSYARYTRKALLINTTSTCCDIHVHTTYREGKLLRCYHDIAAKSNAVNGGDVKVDIKPRCAVMDPRVL